MARWDFADARKTQSQPGARVSARATLATLTLVLPLVVRASPQLNTEAYKGWRLSPAHRGAQAREITEEVARARQSVQDHPDSAPSYLALAKALKAAGDRDEASQALDQALRLGPRLAEAWFQKGTLEADDQKWAAASEDFRRATEIVPNHIPARVALGEMLLRQGEFDDATRELTRVVAREPANAGAHYGLGLIHFQRGELAAAEAEFRRALTYRARFPEALESLAEVLLHRRDWSAAAAAFEQVLAIDPGSVAAANGLAAALTRLGDARRAKEEYHRAHELLQKNLATERAQGENNRGLRLWHEGNLAEAVSALRNALSANPDYAEAHNNLGGVLWQQGNKVDATAEFAAAARARPDFPEAENNWGGALLQTGDPEQAIQHFQAALADRPGFASAHLNLGTAYKQLGELGRAEVELRRALVLAPQMAAAHIELGVVLASKHPVSAEARKELEEGLRLDPRLKPLIPEDLLRQLR